MQTPRLFAIAVTAMLIAAASAQSSPASQAGNAPAPNSPLKSAATPIQPAFITLLPGRTFPLSGMGCDPLNCVDGQHALTAPAAAHQFTQLPAPKLVQTTPGVFQLSPEQAANLKLLAQNSPRSDNPCYTLRSYQFTPATPGSGAGRITGESTCQPATTIHQKAIVVPAAPAKK
jgi:hypothetical protein